MHVFVANYADMATLEAELDDPSVCERSMLDLERLASPQLSHVFLEMTPANCDRVLATALAEYLEMFEGEDQDAPDVRWVFEGHKVPKVGRECWRWTLSDGTVEPQMLVVIQKVEVS